VRYLIVAPGGAAGATADEEEEEEEAEGGRALREKPMFSKASGDATDQ